MNEPDKPNDESKKVGYASAGVSLWQYLYKILGVKDPLQKPAKIPMRRLAVSSAISLVGSLLGIFVVGFIASYFFRPLLFAPFGASAVLLFSVYDSPLAQPRNTVIGHLASAVIGGLFALIHVNYFESGILATEGYIWIAMAVAFSIFVMQIARITHPPAGATAFIAASSVTSIGSFFAFMVPVAVGAIILVAIAIIFNNAVPSRRYPMYW